MRLNIDKHGVIDISDLPIILSRDGEAVGIGISGRDAETAESLFRALLKSAQEVKCIHIHFDREISIDEVH